MRIRRSLAPSFLLLAVLAAVSPAQAGYLNALYSPDGTDVIAVGDSGMIVRTVNAGLNWSRAFQGSTVLRAVTGRGLVRLAAGDGGRILRSTDNGGSWSTFLVPGTPALFSIEMPSPDTAFVAGAGGTLLRSVNGGANWTAQSSGTANRILEVRFLDAWRGWIVGENGFAARTSNGGATWTPAGVSTPNHLYGVDQLGSRVWIVGAEGTCLKSTDDGSNWTPANLRLDSRAEVRSVVLQSADSVFISGGGGFVRRSLDDGASWTFCQSPLLGDASAMTFVGARGFVASTYAIVPMRTVDRGVTWTFPSGTTVTRSWSLKQTLAVGSQRGSSVALNPKYRNTIYACVGSRFYVTRDAGETWTQFSTLPAGYTKVNAFVVSPKDSNLMVCAASPPNVILRSTNGGGSWTVKLSKVFGEYGIPVEMHPDKPDTLLLGGDSSVLWRSTDFGNTWSSYGSTVFRSPCDLIVVPEADSSQVLVGDGITGSGSGEIWRSVDGGVNFNKTLVVTGSEVPGMSLSRLRNKSAFGTNWGAGTIEKTTDTGLTWTISEPGVTATWGTDIARDDPNVVIYGVYSGGTAKLSLDGGSTFASSTLTGSNYSFYARDRGCILAEQSGGLYKLYSTYAYAPSSAQSLALTAPNGAEIWAAGTLQRVTWTSTGVALARIEYRRSPADPWLAVADVPGYYGGYTWLVPHDATDLASVRVSDAWDVSPADSSDAVFTIADPLVSATPPALSFGSHPVSSAPVDSVVIANPGTADLTVASIATGTPAFQVVPASLAVPAGGSAKIYVTFLPVAAQAYDDTVSLVSDAYNAPTLKVPVGGTGTVSAALDLTAPDGGDVFVWGTSPAITWSSTAIANVDLAYRTAWDQPWVTIATAVPAASGSYAWPVPNDPTWTARVRILESGGGLGDSSAADFKIGVPRIAFTPPTHLYLDAVLLGNSRSDTLRIRNIGNHPLHVTSLAVDRPAFTLSRTTLTVPAESADTITVTFTPTAAGEDTTHLTIVSDAPGSPTSLLVTGYGALTTAVGETGVTEFGAWQNQPNPFAGRTRIRFALPRATEVSIEVFNVQGQRVATLAHGAYAPGSHTVEFVARRADGSTLPAGVYFYRLRAGGFRATRKMLLMR